MAAGGGLASIAGGSYCWKCLVRPLGTGRVIQQGPRSCRVVTDVGKPAHGAWLFLWMAVFQLITEGGVKLEISVFHHHSDNDLGHDRHHPLTSQEGQLGFHTSVC